MAHCRKTQLSIFLSSVCNLNCRYCYAKDEHSEKQAIDLMFVQRAINDFFASYESRQIRFFGSGEPTREFSRMKWIKEWADQYSGGEATYELQTNGYFGSEVSTWIEQNIQTVWVSCDGPPEVQDFYRPVVGGYHSSNVVEKNIRSIARQVPTVGCRASIGVANYKRQNEMIDYFGDLGVKYVMSDPLFAPVGTNTSIEMNEQTIDLIEYADSFLAARAYAEKLGMFYGSIFTVNFDEPGECFCRACGPYPHLTPDGYVTCCDMAFSGKQKGMDELVYGEYVPEEDYIRYDQNKIKAIQSRKVSNMRTCDGCEVSLNCSGACLGEAVNETGSMFGVKPNICKVIRYLAKRMPLNTGLYPVLHP